MPKTRSYKDIQKETREALKPRLLFSGFRGATLDLGIKKMKRDNPDWPHEYKKQFKDRAWAFITRGDK